jgi:hypothetical protein
MNFEIDFNEFFNKEESCNAVTCITDEITISRKCYEGQYHADVMATMLTFLTDKPYTIKDVQFPNKEDVFYMFIRYVNDSKVESKLKALEEHKIIDRNVASNISLTDYEITEDSGAGKYEIDKSVSGQYLVTGTNIKFSNGTWDYELTLVRNAADVIPILNNLE